MCDDTSGNKEGRQRRPLHNKFHVRNNNLIKHNSKRKLLFICSLTGATKCVNLTANLLVERVPLGVDVVQVLLQALSAGGLGGALDESLTQRVDVLELRLQRLNLILLEYLDSRQKMFYVTI